jgi:methylmalonyl-CoA mutase
MKKHDGSLPIIGVNTFLDKNGSPTVIPPTVIRANEEEKQFAVSSCEAFRSRNSAAGKLALEKLKSVAVQNGNIFAELMETTKVCSLGQISAALYEVGGQYRRSM